MPHQGQGDLAYLGFDELQAAIRTTAIKAAKIPRMLRSRERCMLTRVPCRSPCGAKSRQCDDEILISTPRRDSVAIDPTAIGAVTEPRTYEWTDRDTLLYALGVGAGADDLAFTTENSHDTPQQVFPTFAVICCMGFAAAPLVGSFNWGGCCTARRRSASRPPPACRCAVRGL